jgi:hypothetical protein
MKGEFSMDDRKKSAEPQDHGLTNRSVNSSRRSGPREDGLGNPVRPDARQDSTESTKVPDQQAPKA